MAKQLRGFALMSAARRREVATQGGIAVQKQGSGHRFSPKEASEAGKRGQRTLRRQRVLAQMQQDQEPNARDQHREQAQQIRRGRVA